MGTGYMWELKEENTDVKDHLMKMDLETIKHGKFMNRVNNAKGSAGEFLFRYKVYKPTVGYFINLHFIDRRPWESNIFAERNLMLYITE